MTDVRYALIKADEDGNPISWLNAKDVADIAQLMEDHGVERFMDDVPAPGERDPSYWPERVALLIEIRVLKVRPKEVVTEWTIER